MLILNEAMGMHFVFALSNPPVLLKRGDLTEVIDEEIYLITLTNTTTYITV